MRKPRARACLLCCCVNTAQIFINLEDEDAERCEPSTCNPEATLCAGERQARRVWTPRLPPAPRKRCSAWPSRTATPLILAFPSVGLVDPERFGLRPRSGRRAWRAIPGPGQCTEADMAWPAAPLPEQRPWRVRLGVTRREAVLSARRFCPEFRSDSSYNQGCALEPARAKKHIPAHAGNNR